MFDALSVAEHEGTVPRVSHLKDAITSGSNSTGISVEQEPSRIYGPISNGLVIHIRCTYRLPLAIALAMQGPELR